MKKAVLAGNEGCSRFDLYHDLAKWLVCRGLGGMASFVLGVAAKAGRAGTEDESNAADDETMAWTATNMSREQRVTHLWLGGATSLAAGDLERAETLLRSAVEVEEASGEAWSILGHVLARKNDTGSEAINAFQTALPLLETTQSNGGSTASIPELPVAQLGQLYNSLGFLYLQKGAGNNTGAAKEVYLRSCRLAPTSTSWLGAGIAALELGAHTDAEDALAEANILNNQNPQIWGYLALLCLQSTVPRVEEADQSLNQAVRLGLGDPFLLERIGASYATLGCYNQAESTLKRSTALSGNGATRKLLGDVMAAQNKFEEALQVYETVCDADGNTDEIRKEAAMGKTAMLEALGSGSKKAW
jgi:tetratricopeptide (TPR) repeat protein